MTTMTALNRKKLRIALIALAVALAILLSGAAIYVLRGEWIYYASQTFRRYAPPELRATTKGEWETWSMDALLADGRVSQNTLLMLVNANHPIPEDFEVELTEYNGARMHPLMVEHYVALRDRVQRRTGVRIYVAADYRSAEEQEQIYAESEAGIAAPVGCSEHEAGLALDLYAPRYDGERFLQSRAGRRVNDVCADYGYIIRYPKGKEEVTGIAYEPWHLRYVGAPHARIINDAGLALEEYFDLLKPDVRYVSGDYLILRCKDDAICLPDGWLSCEISPDNTGYYVITLHMR